MSDVLLLAVGALFGGLATGLVQVYMDARGRASRKTVAARAVMGDIAVAEAAFGLLVERGEWFRYDFGPALATWEKYRGDFIGTVSLADWAQVDAFYSNLARSAALARPHQPADAGNVSVAEAQIEYAKEAWAVVKEHIGGNEEEQAEVVRRMGEGAI